MALYDNKYWLLSHIRNSFISTDDTGMCELVMVGETLPKHLVQELDIYPDSEEEDEEDEIEHESYDIQLDTDFSHSAHRQRSYTAVRLEKMDQARKRAAKIKNVKWDNNIQCTSANVDDFFVKKNLETNVKGNSLPKVSLLTKQLEECTSLPQNPYIEYVKYDGSAQVGQTVRTYKIFLTMLPEEQRNYPLVVSCLATATIQEFIGLILLKCSTMHGGYPLLSPRDYGLYITEEDGEVDRDFPCLNMNECVAKFGFTSLGLVEHKDNEGGSHYAKKVNFDTQRDYYDKEGGADNVDASNLSSALIDDTRQIFNDNRIMRAHTNAMEAPLYKSFFVYIIHRLRGRVAVHLGISGDKIEIDPITSTKSAGPTSSGGKFLAAAWSASGGGRKKQKAVSHLIDSVAWCEMLDNHSSGKNNRRLFRIVYSMSFGGNGGSGNVGGGDQNGPGALSPHLQTSASFKHYDFEADATTANEIVQKVTQILEVRSSSSRKEYLESLERKKLRRSNLFMKSF